MESNKLPEDFKAKWIAALRSGKYKQGSSRLRTNLGKEDWCYCCLAVACIVAGYPEEDINGLYIGHQYDKVPAMLHGSNHDSIPFILGTMNDGDWEMKVAPKSFSEIADYIETNL